MKLKKHYVFVYGTLRKHQGNHHLLEQADLVADQCWTYGKLYDVGCGYPAMTVGEKRVYGELYQLTDKELDRLNGLEGYNGPGKNNHYDRIDQTIYADFGSFTAYVYIYYPEQATQLKEIPSVDWKCYQSLNRDTFYYFAYGSCMDDERFTKQGVAHHFMDVVGRGVLQNFELAFTRIAADGGRADIVEGYGSVEGKVYQVDAEARAYLDKREGANSNIYRPTFVDIEVEGGLLTDVLTYVVVDKEPEIAPPDHYAREIYRGGQGFLSDVYMRKLKADWKRKFNMDVKDFL